MKLNIVIMGLSITSSWGNGHATTYRALVKALSRRGHSVTFLERDMPWYREHRDLDSADYCNVRLYQSLPELAGQFGEQIRDADLAVLGSYVPKGIAIGDWLTSHARGITAFYDIDTPVTLAKLQSNQIEYVSSGLIPRFDLYLSFSGGPALAAVEDLYGGRMARALYCSADVGMHVPKAMGTHRALGYLGTYSEDRQSALQNLLLTPALQLPHRSFAVAGPKYPDPHTWPANVEYIRHLPPSGHAEFYGSQRFTLNLTRSDMKALGFSASVRLFEAAACGVPIISDAWPGIETILAPGKEILLADGPREVVEILEHLPEDRRRAIAANAHSRLLREHTPDHRARQLEGYYHEALSRRQHMPGSVAHGAALEEAK